MFRQKLAEKHVVTLGCSAALVKGKVIPVCSFASFCYKEKATFIMPLSKNFTVKKALHVFFSLWWHMLALLRKIHKVTSIKFCQKHSLECPRRFITKELPQPQVALILTAAILLFKQWPIVHMPFAVFLDFTCPPSASSTKSAWWKGCFLFFLQRFNILDYILPFLIFPRSFFSHLHVLTV